MEKKKAVAVTNNMFGIVDLWNASNEDCFNAVKRYDSGLAREIEYLASIGISAYRAIRNELSKYFITGYENEQIIERSFIHVTNYQSILLSIGRMRG